MCNLVPPRGSHRKKGLWQKDDTALLADVVGTDPVALVRTPVPVVPSLSHATATAVHRQCRPAGLKNLGSTCYVNAVLQCLFAIPSFRRRMYDLDPSARRGGGGGGGGEGNEEGARNRSENEEGGRGGEGGGGGGDNDGQGDGLGGAGADAAGSFRTDVDDGPVEILRRLFASLQASRRKTADPAAFARSLALETGTQQDGQEFLKLLLTYLERAGASSPDPADRTFVADHFRGVSTYATTCQKCQRASEASEKPIDFYEVELNVGATVGGVYVGGDGGGGGGGGSLLESLHEYLAEERLEGDNQYHCERCDAKVDATRAVRLHRLPRYFNFQLKRFVFDFETLSRRKVTDEFKFPLEVDLGQFVKVELPAADFSGSGGGVDGGGEGEVPGSSPGGGGGMYDLAFILVHRGQNATSGHYVALVRDNMESSSAGGGNWWRFDDDEVDELRGGPFGDPVPIVAPPQRTTAAVGGDINDDGAKGGGAGGAGNDDEGGGGGEKKQKQPGRPRKKSATAAAALKGGGGTGPTPSKPKKGRDGSTLGDNEFASPDAYLLVYRRRETMFKGGARAADSDNDPAVVAAAATTAAAAPPLPDDLAVSIKADDAKLQAMIDTYTTRVNDERERLRRRRELARAVAESALVRSRRDDDDDIGGGGGGGGIDLTDEIVRDAHGVDVIMNEEKKEDDEEGKEEEEEDDYYWIPGEWLSSFCNEPTPPSPIDTRPLLCSCPHPLADPAKASSAKRVSRAAWDLCVETAGVHPDAPVLRGPESVCSQCLREAAMDKADADVAEETRAAAREEIKAWERDLGDVGGDNNNPGQRRCRRGYLVSKQWLQRWTTWKSGSPPDVIAAADPTAAVTCEHGKLVPGARCAIVPEKVWEHLKVTIEPYVGTVVGGGGGVKEVVGDGNGEVEDGAVVNIDIDDDNDGAGSCVDVNEQHADDDGGDGGDGGAAAQIANDRAMALAIAEVGVDDVFIVGETGGSVGRVKKIETTTKKKKSTAAATPIAKDNNVSIPRWTGPIVEYPVTLDDGDVDNIGGGRSRHLVSMKSHECQVCAAVKEVDAAAVRERKDLAALHFSTCADLLHRITVDVDVDDVGAVNEYRLMPARWLASWRQFATGGGGGKDRVRGWGKQQRATGGESGVLKQEDKNNGEEENTFRPTHESLAEAAASLRCHHGLLQFPLPRLTLVSRSSGQWTQGNGGGGGEHLSDVHDETVGGSEDAGGATELISSAAFEMLEMVLGDLVGSAVPRVTVTFKKDNDVGHRDDDNHQQQQSSRCVGGALVCTADPGLCEECIKNREAAVAAREKTYVGAVVKIEKVKSPPVGTVVKEEMETTPPAATTTTIDSTIDEEKRKHFAKNKKAVETPPPPPSGTRHSTRRRAAQTNGPTEWWKVDHSSKVSGTNNRTRGGGGGGRAAVPFIVDATYTVWQMKLMILERMAIHPLDQSLYSFATGAELAGGDNSVTLAAAGVKPESRVALVARADHDPEDLTGLEMPLGPVKMWWEGEEKNVNNNGGGGGGSGRGGSGGGGGGNKSAAAPERGFAGTGLIHG